MPGTVDPMIYGTTRALQSGRDMHDERGQSSTFPYAELTRQIIGVFFEVFRELGHGFSEVVYQRALLIALRQAGLRVESEVQLPVFFRGHCVGAFQADLVVDCAILIEVKASKMIEGYAQAQLLNYLKAAGGGTGLLLNFGPKPDFKRLVMGNPTTSLPRLPA
jgi:GxxExxY protein